MPWIRKTSELVHTSSLFELRRTQSPRMLRTGLLHHTRYPHSLPCAIAFASIRLALGLDYYVYIVIHGISPFNQ